MAILKVYKYPSMHLRDECQPVTNIASSTVQQLVKDMVETMYSFPGSVGLAAPQVGFALRIFVIDTNAKTTKDNLRVMINPEIVSQTRNKLIREGCLSFPDYLANVKRGTRVTVKYTTPDGELVEVAVRDLEAIAVQHELDHLDGVLMIDRVNSLKTDLIRRYSAPANTANQPQNADATKASNPSA